MGHPFISVTLNQALSTINVNPNSGQLSFTADEIRVDCTGQSGGTAVDNVVFVIVTESSQVISELGTLLLIGLSLAGLRLRRRHKS